MIGPRPKITSSAANPSNASPMPRLPHASRSHMHADIDRGDARNRTGGMVEWFLDHTEQHIERGEIRREGAAETIQCPVLDGRTELVERMLCRRPIIERHAGVVPCWEKQTLLRPKQDACAQIRQGMIAGTLRPRGRVLETRYRASLLGSATTPPPLGFRRPATRVRPHR